MKSFLKKKIARELTGNLHKHPTKFPGNSRAIFLRNDFIIVRLLHLRNPAKNLLFAELRLMRNPPLVSLYYGHHGNQILINTRLQCIKGEVYTPPPPTHTHISKVYNPHYVFITGYPFTPVLILFSMIIPMTMTMPMN